MFGHGAARTLMHMTRENKLALVVGFGLILLVGVLISDHFSTARNQESADLRQARPSDPLSEVRRSDPALIDLQVRGEPPANNGLRAPLATNTSRIPSQESQTDPQRETPAASESDHNNGVRQIVMGEPAPSNGSAATERQDRNGRDVPFIFHDVRAGENLTSIARRYYDTVTADLVNDLAAFNGLEDANALRANHRLRIPASGDLRRGAPAPAQTQSARESAPDQSEPVYTTYTVQRGDTLSELSLQLLGTSRRWRELYELNRNAIRDPDNLLAGTVLKVPRPG